MRTKRILLGLASLPLALSLHAAETEDELVEIEEIALKSESEADPYYETGPSRTSTGLGLSILETPQSLSVITRDQMDDFALDTVNDVLKYAPGVNVEAVETDRTFYTARGFDITNFQVDGMGVPMTFGNVYGSLDTAIYERVEVLRGANGLMVGTGNPSATINFVRKKPTSEFDASLDATYGSWSFCRGSAGAEFLS